MSNSHSLKTLSIIAIIALSASTITAGSIYSKAARRYKSLYADDKAAAVGDLLTIVITESTKIDTSADRAMEKSSEGSMKANLDAFGIGRAINKLTGGGFSLDDLDIEMGGENKFDGKATYGTDSSVDDEVTVIVEDVLPNGNLVILGKRIREIEGEKQLVQISGIVRPRDIGYTNKISSKQVANYHMIYKHTGRENRFTKPGWLGQILNYINPF